ncbi:helix-turn-helix domain-containing protein [Bacillus subtilis]|uniref:hypothetical protein n=1 Tax=Bacillus subtilis TaxID=1423 RepID=UPI0011A6E3B9|nr:hypothetical protein [Bacillus subtilis]TWG76374.1 hypothetical protein L604_004100000030 [Bacillus subtilis J27]
MFARDYLYAHHSDNDGTDKERYIYIGPKENGKFPRKYMRPVSFIKALKEDSSILAKEDVFYSLNAFWQSSRKADDIRHLRALYVDLDCYTVGKTPVEVFEILEEQFFHQVIPEPNAITFTGRGLNCIWWIEHAPKQAIKTWKRVNRYLFEQLTQFGADSKCAEDVSRVFRVPGTINSKSGQRVQVKVRHENRFNLRELNSMYTPWETFEPKKPTAIQVEAGRKAGKKSRFTLQTLNKARLQDLRTLQTLRNEQGISEGYRATAVMLYNYFAGCLTGDTLIAWDMTKKYNKQFIKPLSESEIRGMKRYAEEKAIEWLNAFANFELKWQKPESATDRKGLQISNKRLLDLLGVVVNGKHEPMTEEEQRQMLTIIGEEEYKRRERIRQAHNREKNGQIKRHEYIKKQHDKTDDMLFKLQALLEANPKVKKTELAKQLGVSRQHLYRLLKQI